MTDTDKIAAEAAARVVTWLKDDRGVPDKVIESIRGWLPVQFRYAIEKAARKPATASELDPTSFVPIEDQIELSKGEAVSQYYQRVEIGPDVAKPDVIKLYGFPVEVDEIPEVRRLRKTIESFSETEREATTEEIQAAGFDPWHPASEPPTPEDFEPTGRIHLINVNDPTAVVKRLKNATHWQHITPPK